MIGYAGARSLLVKHTSVRNILPHGLRSLSAGPPLRDAILWIALLSVSFRQWQLFWNVSEWLPACNRVMRSASFHFVWPTDRQWTQTRWMRKWVTCDKRLHIRRQAHDVNLSPLGSCTQTHLQLDQAAGGLRRQTQRPGGVGVGGGGVSQPKPTDTETKGCWTAETTWTPQCLAAEWAWFLSAGTPLDLNEKRPLFGPQTLAQQSRMTFGICGQADGLHSKHQLKG